MPIKLTRELAFAASLDAGNRSMYAAGRAAWDETDQAAAAREFDRLWPLCQHKADRECCGICLASE